MYVLGLESSCDETACAIIEARPEGPLELISSVISSQIAIHARFGGVVPEVAARQHLLQITPLLREALTQAGLPLSALHGIAVTRGPGLVGALLVAVQVAKTLAYAHRLPLIGVHHLEGHLMAAYLRSSASAQGVPPPPYLGLLVSGGHTSLVWVEALGRLRVVGSTRDDAAGEAFDKVGKLMGLGYPAGPLIDRLSTSGDPDAVPLSRAMLGPKAGLDFSFSGLKTQLSEHLSRQQQPLSSQALQDLSASFQKAVVEQLVRKTERALDQLPAKGVVLAGGVACNRAIRSALAALAERRGLPFFVPPPDLCTDNAAMIAAAGYYRLSRGERSGLDLNPVANLPLETAS